MEQKEGVCGAGVGVGHMELFFFQNIYGVLIFANLSSASYHVISSHKKYPGNEAALLLQLH